MGCRISFSSFFVRFPLCKMFVKICFTTDGLLHKVFWACKADRGTDRHIVWVYITYVEMYKDVCQQLAPFASASFHVCPCLLTMMLMLMMVMDGQQAEQQTQHTSTQIDPSFSVSNSRSLSLSLLLSFTFFGQLCQSNKVLWADWSIFSIRPLPKFSQCLLVLCPPTHTLTRAQRKLYQLFRL